MALDILPQPVKIGKPPIPSNSYSAETLAEIQAKSDAGDPSAAAFLRSYHALHLHEKGQGSAPEPPADPWQAYTLADAYAERPPLEYLAGNLFQLPSLSIVYGAPGTLKSLLLQYFTVRIANGLRCLPAAPWQPINHNTGFEVKPAPVMWIDFDNGNRRTHNRFEALGRASNAPATAPLTYYSMPAPWLSATQPESIGSLSARIKAAAAKLVVIDNLGNVSGDADENSAAMGTVMAQFRRIAEETTSAIVLIHHQRKGANNPTSRAGDALRGHSSIEAALDLALLVEREDYSDTINIRATKVRGADVLPFSAVFTYEGKPDSDELETALFYGVEAEDTKSNLALDRALLAQLAELGECNKTALVRATKKIAAEIGINRIRNRIDWLANENRIKATAGDRTERLYSL